MKALGPKVLIVALRSDWLGISRLPRELHRAGIRVAALCLPEAYLRQTRYVDWYYLLRQPSPQAAHWRQALVQAVADWRPLLIIPGDDPATLFLHETLLAGNGVSNPCLPPRIHRSVSNSLGDPCYFGATINKNLTHRVAAELGVRAPPQRTVAVWADAMEFFSEQRGNAVVLKHPLSWAGIDVHVCRTRKQLRAAFEALQDPPPARVPDHGRPGSRAGAPVVSSADEGLRLRIERFIEGTPASYALAAWRGELLAGYPLLKEQFFPPDTGPASVVRALKHQEITATAKALTSRFKLTGFAEFDFMIERRTGRAFLLECNARPSMLSVVGSRFGVDLSLALAARLRGQSLPAMRLRSGKRVALFPQAWWSEPANPLLHTPAHDVPWDDPGLVKHLV